MEMGADDFVVSTNEESMAKGAGTLDIILNTVSVKHQSATYMPLLARNGVQVLIGVTVGPQSVSTLPF